MPALSHITVTEGSGAGSSLTVASSARNLAGGNHNLVFVRFDGATTSITVTDTAGNTYTSLTQRVNSGGTFCSQWFHCLNATGNAANVVTATFGSARTQRALRVHEASGTAPTSVYELVTIQTAAGTAAMGSDAAGSINAGTGSLIYPVTASSSDSTAPTYTDSGGSTLTRIGTSLTIVTGTQKAYASAVRDDYVTISGMTSSTTRNFSVLVLDSDGIYPAVDTHARLSQLPVEVIRTNTAVKARTSQVVVEVLRINTGTKIRASQLAVEVLRPNVGAAASSARPVVMICT